MDRYVTHATFTLERSYPVPPARVFAAWADPAAKARWFTPNPDSGHELDFRVGGREVARGGPDGGPVMTFETLYREIVPDQRIVYTSTLADGDDLITVSLTTVEFSPAEGGTRPGGGTGPGGTGPGGTGPGGTGPGGTGPGGTGPGGTGPGGGTRLVLTEQGAFLDGREQPAWREQGTADQLEALAKELIRDPA